MPRNLIREAGPKETNGIVRNMDPPAKEMRSLESSPAAPVRAQSSCASLKMFLVALSFAYFAKSLSGSYMKSTITQLERRFDIPSYLVGVIDGSFEIGNLLVIAFVSYFGAKLHRPKIIAVGCLLMSIGTFFIALPHFIIGRYKFGSPVRPSVNSTNIFSPCPASSPEALSAGDNSSEVPIAGCERESSLSMWIYVLLGNVLRGIGETPVQPLGISYIDDHALEENAAFYIGCIQTIMVIGPVFGYLLGSLCAKIYVDIGFVNMENISIDPGDARWVGAWWLGYLIAGFLTLLSAIPFWFLPKSLPLPVDPQLEKGSPEQANSIKEHKYQADEPTNCLEMAKDFLPALKSLLGNPVYFLYLCVTIIQFNSLIGMVTYKPKYIEQHYGKSASTANFLMGVINIPAVALGIFSGGVVMKKFKLSIMGAAKFALGTSLLGYALSFLFLAMGCENSRVAGITVSYEGVESPSYHESTLYVECNAVCHCSGKEWDPVCGEDGITYASPCLAGCLSSRGSGKTMMFGDCSCVGAGNQTARVGLCQDRKSCDNILPYFLTVSVLTSFIISLGGTPGYMLLIRCIQPQLKSLALGFHTLATRTLAGIPAPIYFGAIIDTTCLKWGQKSCGGRGACRVYDTAAYRTAYLGLTLGLRAVSFLLCIWGFVVLRRQVRRQERTPLTNGALADATMAAELEALRKDEAEAEENQGSDHESQAHTHIHTHTETQVKSQSQSQSQMSSDCNQPERETRL